LIGVRAEDKQILAWLVYGWWNLAIMVFVVVWNGN